MKTKCTLLLFFATLFATSFAQENKSSNFNLSAGADIASSYLWRGIEQGTGPAIQPWGEVGYKGFAIGAWGSHELIGEFKEFDFYAKYTLKNVTVLFTDFFYPGYEGLNQNFYNFKSKTTGHAAELSLSYNGSETIPFTVSGGVMLYGAAIDASPTDSTKSNYSTYFEVNYLGKFKDYSFNVFAGFTPTKSVLYQTSGFSVFNLGVSAKKAIKVTDSFSLPLKLTVATNPSSEKIFMALQISL